MNTSETSNGPAGAGDAKSNAANGADESDDDKDEEADPNGATAPGGKHDGFLTASCSTNILPSHKEEKEEETEEEERRRWWQQSSRHSTKGSGIKSVPG